MQVKDEETPRAGSRRARLMERVQAARKTVAAVLLCMILFASGFLMGLYGRSPEPANAEPTYTGIYQVQPSDVTGDLTADVNSIPPVTAQQEDEPVTIFEPETAAPATAAGAGINTNAGTTGAATPASLPPVTGTPASGQVVAGLAWPVEGSITRGAGWLYSLTLEHWVYLPGVDIQAQPGAPVTASIAGTVKSISYEPVLGNVLILEHEGGTTTTYGRLASIRPALGAKVEAGQTVGAAGPDAVYFAVYSGTEALDAQECLAKPR